MTLNEKTRRFRSTFHAHAALLLGAVAFLGIGPLHAAKEPTAPLKAATSTTYHYVAKTAGTAKKQGPVKAGGLVWQCRGNQCTTSGPWPTPAVTACQALAGAVGPIEQYGHATKQLNNGELGSCNRAVAGTKLAPKTQASAPASASKPLSLATPTKVPAAKTPAATLRPQTAAGMRSAPGMAGAAPSAAGIAPGVDAGMRADTLPGAVPGMPGAGGGAGAGMSREMIEEMRTAAAGISTLPRINQVVGSTDSGYCSISSFAIVGTRFGAEQAGRKVMLARRGVALAEASVRSWSDTTIRAAIPRDPDIHAGQVYTVGIQDGRGQWVSGLSRQVRLCPDTFEVGGTIRVENCGAGASNIEVALTDSLGVRRVRATGVEGNDFLFQYRASGLRPATYEVRPTLTGIECRGGAWTPDAARVDVSYRQPTITRDLEYRVATRTWTLGLTALAGIVREAFRGLEIHLNNYDPATGGQRENDSYVRLPERIGGGEWRLGLLPARTGPRTYYVNDVNLESVRVLPWTSGLRLQLDFETADNAGRLELVGTCKDDAGCIVGAPHIDMRLRVLIDLTLARHVMSTGSSLSYSDVRVTAEPTTRVDGACQLNVCAVAGLPLPIQECIVDICDIATNYKSLIKRVVEENITAALDTREVRDRIAAGIRPELERLGIGTINSVRVEGTNLVLVYLDNAR